ncbi:MAG: endonuclease/exonuclease/phosphatase family protein [Gammaproteobacteria bacterium]|nr:endonuclease/exonuclease/phosphatase family protein [Gammaproteobacteria bacterium]
MPRLVSYNVHDCIGTDRRYSPERIADVLAGLDADVVALQEVTLDHAGDVLRVFREVTGMHETDGTLFDRGVGRYGNLLLSRSPPLRQAVDDISIAGREARGVLDVELTLDGRRWRIFATHLGLGMLERRVQLGQVMQLAAQSDADFTVLMGDFNVWTGSAAFRPLIERGFSMSRVRSFPTRVLPLFALDRILVRGDFTRTEYSRYDGGNVATASDHFPVVADLRY